MGIFDFLSPKKRRMNRRLKAAKQTPKEKSLSERLRLGHAVPGLGVLEQARKAEAEKARQAAARLLNNPLGRFLYMSEHVTDFHSSCVKSFWYEITTKTLHIQFKERSGGSSTYAYGKASGVPPDMAMSLFNAKSKGVWVWDRLRIRGTKLGHQIEYIMEVAPPSGRAYQQSPEAEAAHHAQVEAESVYDRFATTRQQNLGRHESGHGGKYASIDPATGKFPLP